MNYFRLGRIYGINIHVNWSWLLIFALVSWSLSLTFGQIHQEWHINMRWTMAVLGALLFFVSVLAHELAHSLVALTRGVPVANITLFLFGGVSNMQREPSSPAEEFVITVVGPLTSLFLGAVCLAVGAGRMVLQVDVGSLTTPTILSELQPLNTTLAWLGSVNLLIGFFNLIPAFPLDGGRIIRAGLWALLKDVRRSTRWAIWMGQGIAWMMIVGGVAMVFGVNLPIIGGGLFNGLWLIFIGVFLVSAAQTGYRQTVMDDKLATVQVHSVMQTRVPIVQSSATLGDLLSKNLTQPDGHTLFVTDGEDVIGMVAIREAKRSFNENAHTRSTTTVGDIMTPVSDLLYVSADEDVGDALERLQHFNMRHMPVMLNNRIVGLLHRTDIQRLLQLNSEFGS